MKIAILTFHSAHNYGAVWQAYALKTHLQNIGHDVLILNYQNQTIQSNYDNRIPYKYGFGDIIHIRRLPKAIKSNFETACAQKHFKRRCEGFDTFIQGLLLEGNKKVLSLSDIKNYSCDIFISGSDQVWNSELTGDLDPVYFLDFKTSARKLFFGCSTGYSEIKKDEEDYFKKCLTEANMVSVREKDLSRNLSKICGKQVYTVVDPTILLKSEKYRELFSNLAKPKEKYVLLYLIYEDSKALEIAEYVARVLQLKLLEFRCFYRIDLRTHNQITDKNPLEFLNYVDNAEFVITNSFHGTVFSILFEKRFYSVFKSDARKGELLQMLNLKKRQIFSKKEVDFNDDIDYVSVRKKTEEYKRETINLLNDCIQNCE